MSVTPATIAADRPALLDERLLQLAHRRSVDYLRGAAERHVGAVATRDELLRVLDAPLADAGEDPARVIELLSAQVPRGNVTTIGPRYFGFVIGGTLPVALAADWLTSAWDQNAATFALSPLAVTVEEIAARWLTELFGLPNGVSVGFVTGCQMANFTGLAAARNAVLRKCGWNVEEEGLVGAPRVNLVTSAESHVTIDVAMRFLGFGTRSLLRVESDEQGRMRPDRLRRLLANLSGPTIVCAQAGNVNTGAFDPLREIATLTRAHDAWLHVDGAFGLWAAASRDLRPLVDGIELADSWATDGHKWLNVPYDSGIVLIRDADAHRQATSSTAAYLERREGEERSAVDWVPEFSRRARAFPIYAVLRSLGRDGIAQLIDRSCARARQMAELLRKHEGVAILNDVVLNQVLVRFDDDDAVTRATVDRVQADGVCWLGGTTWHGRGAMRIAFSNWSTSEADVERSGEAILRAFSFCRRSG